jgi:hypothetical protein
MADQQINYIKEALKSNPNLIFVGVMLFLMITVNFWGFLPLLVAGELLAAVLSQNSQIQRIIALGKLKEQRQDTEEAQNRIVNVLPPHYQADFQAVRNLCQEIERRAGELDSTGTNVMLKNIIDKLSAFRHDYVQMLRAHHFLSSRDYRNMQTALAGEVARVERAVGREESPQVRQALTQNLNILRKRLARIKKLEELVRLLEARLQVVKNSLGLIQDEVYSFTNVEGISGLVDNLMLNLSINDELRAAYADVLSEEATASGLTELEDLALPSGLIAPAAETARTTAPTQPRKQRGQIRQIK